jgi:hypothetical protein
VARKHTFTAAIKNAGGGGGFVEIPFDVEEIFGSRRPKIRAGIEGQPYRGTLVRMGGPHHMLIVLKAIREKIGKSFGDRVKVTLEEDLQPRVVSVPPDLRKHLEQDKLAGANFKKLSYTHQKEFVRWIEGARRSETRRDRLARTTAMLRQGKRPR